MRVLIYGDFRSPHAIGWKEGVEAAGIEVLALSSEPTAEAGVFGPTGAVARGRQKFVAAQKQRKGRSTQLLRWLSARQIVHSIVQIVRGRSRTQDLRAAVERFNPDLVHALRLPYEGLTALASRVDVPVVVSSWGQDFDPQARADPLLRHWIRKHLPSAAGFQFDSHDDHEHARSFGLPVSVPSLHAAGNFGVNVELAGGSDAIVAGRVVYARKVSPNCNYFGFIEAALRLIDSTDAQFIGVGLGKLEDEVVKKFGDYDHTRLELVGELERDEFDALVRSAEVVVSPSYSDGMPITVLQAAASGAKIVAGELPQLRSLRDCGVLIDLIDARSASQIADGIERQLSAPSPSNAVQFPPEYSRSANIARVIDFYEQVLLVRK